MNASEAPAVKDGLYRVCTGQICAGFIVEQGKVRRAAPILRALGQAWLLRAIKTGTATWIAKL